MWVRSLRWEDPLEEGMAAHSSILAQRIRWTEEPGRLQSTGSKTSWTWLKLLSIHITHMRYCSSTTHKKLHLQQVLEWTARPGISGCKQQRFQIPQGRKKVFFWLLLLVWFGLVWLESQLQACSNVSPGVASPGSWGQMGLTRAWESSQEFRVCSKSKATPVPRSL